MSQPISPEAKTALLKARAGITQAERTLRDHDHHELADRAKSIIDALNEQYAPKPIQPTTTKEVHQPKPTAPRTAKPARGSDATATNPKG